MMTPTRPNPSSTYDQIPYESLPFRFSHPGHVATIARLFGLQPPPLDNCRVLELGCASGGNLIPLAEALPASRFLGIDLSERQIADGRQNVSALGLSNIELQALSVTHIDESFGEFDYIIAHGLYSWVAEPIREAILALCRERLGENGIAYLSYNTYPGWHISGMLREMMLFHAARLEDPKLKLDQARSLLEFLAGSLPEQHPYGSLLKGQLQELRKAKDYYLAHEYLELDNHPLYFHEFVVKAMNHGLQYLGDAEFGSMFMNGFTPQVQQTLQRIAPDQISQEQYLDFLRNRTFRQSLLVHQEQSIERTLNPENARGLYVASAAKPVSSPPDIRSTKPEQFRAPNSPVSHTCDLPILKAAMLEAAESWPMPILFEELYPRARSRLLLPGMSPDPSIGDRDRIELATALQRSFASGLVELSVVPALFTNEVGEMPVASPLARLQAKAGESITNRRHEPLDVDQLARMMLTLVDGTRDRLSIVEALIEMALDETVTLQRNGVAVKDPATLRNILTDYVDKALTALAKTALLVA